MNDMDSVVIYYLHEHIGYTHRIIGDTQFLPKSDPHNKRILQELRKGLQRSHVREYLQCDYDSSPITVPLMIHMSILLTFIIFFFINIEKKDVPRTLMTLLP